MKTTPWFAMFSLLALAPSALAQTQQEHQQHHPVAEPPAAQAQPAPVEPAQPPAATTPRPQAQMPMGEMMKGMLEHCRAMMQNMPAGCMGMMQGQSGMMQGQARQAAAQSDATKDYMAALDKMHGPMMQGVQESDPDVAFAKGMIAHHQGAIDMANVVLKYGEDDQTKKRAKDVVREQQREIDEMQAWLSQRGK